MTARILTLNVEGRRHLDRVRYALARFRPDIVCLQEVLEEDCPVLQADLGYDCVFAPNAQLPPFSSSPSPVRWGIAIMTHLPMSDSSSGCYSADSALRTLVHPADSRRMLLTAGIRCEGVDLHVMTTHFTWSDGGQETDLQVADFGRLKNLLAPHAEYVLCGDFNAPRGKGMFARFVRDLRLADHLPAEVSTTLDPLYHRAGALDFVVDTIFSTSGYSVGEVEVIEGLSDHKGILGTIRRR